MDIRVVITKGLAYGGIVLIVTGAYVGAISGLDYLFIGHPGYNPAMAHAALFIVVMAIMIFVLPQMKIRAIELVRNALFRGKYDYQQVLVEASREILLLLDLPKLSQFLVSKAQEAMQAKSSLLLLFNEHTKEYILEATQGKEEYKISHLTEKSPLMQLLKKRQTTLVKEAIEKSFPAPEAEKIKAEFEELKSEICVPLISKERLIGVMGLGNKLSGEIYTDEDLGLLLTLANQAAIVFENIRLYNQMLRDDRLTSLGTLAAGVAHEMRNPLSPIKTFLQLLPEKMRKANIKLEQLDADYIGEYYKTTVDSVDRLNEIIEGLLDYARYREPAFERQSVNELLEKTLLLLNYDINKNHIKLTCNFQKDLPEVIGDKGQLQQVFVNIIKNGVEALLESKTEKKLLITTEAKPKSVLITFSDTGKGISKEDQENIFNPFYTTKAQGTGLGLATVYRILQDHHGRINFKSEKDLGTTFFVSLPTAEAALEQAHIRGEEKNYGVSSISPKMKTL
jgi:signal transduction histidine kinase